MKIAVCLKQVPETAEIRLDPRTHTLVRQGVRSVINPFDENALEEAIRLRERFGGTITVLSMGPRQAVSALRDAISLGADDAVLLNDPRFAGSDTLATSYCLSLALKKLGPFDLSLLGKQAIDGDTAHVGPEIAEQLGLGFAAFVRKIEMGDDRSVRVERLTDDGYEILRFALPVLFTVVREINTPRLPSLKAKLESRKYEPVVWNADEIGADLLRIGLAGSPTRVNRVWRPDPGKTVKFFEGDSARSADLLAGELRSRGLI